MDLAACYTLKTRQAYYYLKGLGKSNIYEKYLKGEITRNELYSFVPEKELSRVINVPISGENNKNIFKTIDSLLGTDKVDLLIGGHLVKHTL